MTQIPIPDGKKEKREIAKMFAEYHRAQAKLIQKREELFPIGCRVRCKLTHLEATVIEGSLYAGQINTTSGHWGWVSLERIDA